MTPPMPLIDTQLERMFVAALIREPSVHSQVELGVDDLADMHAQSAYEAFANARARGAEPTLTELTAELQKRHDLRGPHRPGEETLQPHDLRWLANLVALPLPPDPPIVMWSGQLIEIAEARRALLSEAPEPTPRKNPTGPRAVNAEPVRLAESFRRYLYEQAEEPTLVRWARAWWRYEGTRYVEHDDESLDRDIIKFLDVVVAPRKDKETGATHYERITSRNKTINEVRKACLHVFPLVGQGAPQWTSAIDGDADPTDLAPCANGILDLRTLELLPRTPRLFSTTAIASPWTADVPPPTAWLAFLRSLWGDDAETILALQQMFGYLLTPDTSQQKMFALIGPPRSGKSTIARVLKALLGDDAVVNPTLASLEEPFGLAPLVGRTVAIIGDARLGGREDQAKVVERLLSISGEDPLSINRKNRDAINVRLRTRVLLLSNELPRLYDTSGALASRFLLLCLSKSFLGSEDVTLERRLLEEMPGIFRWAVEGRTDLHERGRFVAPLASEAAIEQLHALSSPLTVFLDECCTLAPERQVEIDALFARYLEWCKANGRDRPGSKQSFGRDLNTLQPGIQQTRPRLPDGRRVRMYLGVGLA